MSNVGINERSFLPLSYEDLAKLAEIAKRDRETFFKNNSQWKIFADRVLCIALCQGAAQHYFDMQTGINDFDIYTFYKKHPRKRWYAKRIKSYDFGLAKFGQSSDSPNFMGRRVDCLAREIDIQKGEDIVIALRRYLSDGKTNTAKHLASNAVVMLEPTCGKIVWPLNQYDKERYR